MRKSVKKHRTKFESSFKIIWENSIFLKTRLTTKKTLFYIFFFYYFRHFAPFAGCLLAPTRQLTKFACTKQFYQILFYPKRRTVWTNFILPFSHSVLSSVDRNTIIDVHAYQERFLKIFAILNLR